MAKGPSLHQFGQRDLCLIEARAILGMGLFGGLFLTGVVELPRFGGQLAA